MLWEKNGGVSITGIFLDEVTAGSQATAFFVPLESTEIRRFRDRDIDFITKGDGGVVGN